MNELHLLKRRKKGLLKYLFSLTSLVILLLLLNVAVLVGAQIYFTNALHQIFGSLEAFSIIAMIVVANTDMDSSGKVIWCLIIAASSLFGIVFFIYTRIDIGRLTIGHGYTELIETHKDTLREHAEVMEKLRDESPETLQLTTYLNQSGTFPVTTGNRVQYFPIGEDYYAALLTELKRAKRFIFLEYFIIDEGEMWCSILKVLADKAREGVDVRVLYDGTCAIALLPYDYPKRLQELQIQAKMFSPIRPFMSTHYNYRDHRKIAVIDGWTGFTGGINLADEYINKRLRFGHWKDTGVQIEGPAVRNLTLMFLNMWCLGEADQDYTPYLKAPVPLYQDEPGYVLPYGDNPFDRDKVGENVYIDILHRANSYVHIMTPYLVLDDELLTALRYTAMRGIDVKLMLPGIPDKKAVYAVAKSYFRKLYSAGVKIYIYEPGFLHAKVFVSDDEKAVVSTINLDYRSLYHHFECGTYLYRTSCIPDIERDFQETLRKCIAVDDAYIRKENIVSRTVGYLARLAAPLL